MRRSAGTILRGVVSRGGRARDGGGNSLATERAFEPCRHHRTPPLRSAAAAGACVPDTGAPRPLLLGGGVGVCAPATGGAISAYGQTVRCYNPGRPGGSHTPRKGDWPCPQGCG